MKKLHILILYAISLLALIYSLLALSSMQWSSEWNREWAEMNERLMVLEDIMNQAPVLERTPSGYARFRDHVEVNAYDCENIQTEY